MAKVIGRNPKQPKECGVISHVGQEGSSHRVGPNSHQSEYNTDHKNAQHRSPGITKLGAMDSSERSGRHCHCDHQSKLPAQQRI